MCGIYAIISGATMVNKKNIMPLCYGDYNQKTHNDAVTTGQKNQKLLRHRGPDWEGEYKKGRVYIAHHRLSIIDPVSGGQPLVYNGIETDNKDIVLSVNGEIYNHKDLKEKVAELWSACGYGKYEYMTGSDCEVIIPLYIYYTRKLVVCCREEYFSGTTNEYSEYMGDMMSMLDGMFSFVLYDEWADMTLVARDPLGITSLYYGFDHNGIYHVSSEMKAFDNQITPLLFPAGHYMFMEYAISGAPTPVKYYNDLDVEKLRDTCDYTHIDNEDDRLAWEVNRVADLDKINVDHCKMIREYMIDAVDKRMQTDVQFGVLLSGGLDSSLVASIVTRIASGHIPSKYGINPGEFGRISTFSIGLEGSPDLEAAEKVAQFLGTKHHTLKFTVDEGMLAIRDLIWHLETYDVTTIRASTPMYLLARKIKAMGIKMVLSGEGSDELFGGYLYFLQAPDGKSHQEERRQRLANLQYADNLRANKSTMAWGLEARVPFEDKALVRYGLHEVPSKLMRANGVEKWILREAFNDRENPWLPDSILWRQKEQFSDGVGYSWIDRLKLNAEDKVTDMMLELARYRYPVNTPVTKEEYYYRTIFEELFPGKNWDMTVQKWTPRMDWKGVSYDPSGRAQKTHNNRVDVSS